MALIEVKLDEIKVVFLQYFSTVDQRLIEGYWWLWPELSNYSNVKYLTNKIELIPRDQLTVNPISIIDIER